VDRDAFRTRLLECLGGPWPEPCPLNLQIEAEWQEAEGHVVRRITYEVEPGDRVPAYVLIPAGVGPERRAPAAAVWHQHNGQYHLGKSEPAGVAGDPMHHTGLDLVRAGYVVLCPDALCFEARQDPTGRLRGRDYERFVFLRYVVDGKCLAWKNILDMRRAVDVLESMPEVDAGRIGCYGHSMGATHGWLVGPWEPRLRCIVCNCCLPTYAAIHREHMLHCFPNFIPGLHAFGDTPDVAALIAPKPLHMNFGGRDQGSPIDEVRRAVERIAAAYAEKGCPESFSVYIEEGAGHVLSPVMWRRAKAFLDGHLMRKP